MDFLCFSNKHNNYAINIKQVYKIITDFSPTQFLNKDEISVYLISYLGNIIPVYDINNEYKIEHKKVLLFHTENIFGIFIDDVTEIVRHNIPGGYNLLSIEDIERKILKTSASEESTVELF